MARSTALVEEKEEGENGMGKKELLYRKRKGGGLKIQKGEVIRLGVCGRESLDCGSGWSARIVSGWIENGRSDRVKWMVQIAPLEC